jgi:predicted nucleotidyltransferase
MMESKILSDAEMRALPDLLYKRVQAILGDHLVGFYLVGSLVTGDFDPLSSDVDLIALTAGVLTEAEVDQLEQMHLELIRDDPRLDNRIEVLYTPVGRLNGDQQDYNVAEISPGEPFHVKEIHHDQWTINWYVLREKGVTLFGPNPRTLVDPIAHEKIVRVVQDLSRDTPNWFEPSHLGGQGYVILTLCRGLRLVRTGDFVSKKQAAQWAAQQFPEWSDLILKTLVWRVVRHEPTEDAAALYPEIRRLAVFLIDQILAAT